MELQQIRYFPAVARERNFTRGGSSLQRFATIFDARDQQT